MVRLLLLAEKSLLLLTRCCGTLAAECCGMAMLWKTVWNTKMLWIAAVGEMRLVNMEY